MNLYVLVALITLPLAADPPAGLSLVADGRPQAVVVLADQPSVAARGAAELFLQFIEQISGARLPRTAESKLGETHVEGRRLVAFSSGSAQPATFVLLGQSKLAAQLGATANGLGPGGVLIRTYPNALVILGPDDQTPTDPDGTRYAATIFLEEALGVRCLWPGDLGTVVPRRATLTIGPLNVRHTPPIGQRKIRNSHYNDRLQQGLDYLGLSKAEFDRQQATVGTARWFDWQRLGGSVGVTAGHAFGYTWEKYHLEHPEWFALQPNGSRDLSKLTPERARLCKSNLALIDALARDKIEELRRHGGAGASLCPNDGGRATFCQCPDCRRLDPPAGRPITLWNAADADQREFAAVSLTDRMVWFWNHLAERIAQEFPSACLGVYAYSAYKAPPIREKLHSNLAVGFVGVSYASDAARAEGRADWEAWSKMARKIYWRPNLLLFARREGTPAVYVHKLAEDLRFFAERSLLGVDFDSCMHNWATEGLNYYVLARLLWNPQADVDAIVDDYCRAGFGAAAADARRYFDRIEHITNRIAAEQLPITAPYTPEIVAELRTILDAATGKANDELCARRVAFLRVGLEFTTLQHRAHALLAHANAAGRSNELKAAVRTLQQEKWLLMRQIFRTEPMAVNVAMVAWGSEGLFRRLGWSGAKSVPKAVVEADEEGRPVVAPAGGKP